MMSERMTDDQIENASKDLGWIPLRDIEHQETRREAVQAIDQLRKQKDHWERECRDWEEREAAVCPEDYGFEEVITQLRTDLAAMTERAEKAEAECTRCVAAFGGVATDLAATREKLRVAREGLEKIANTSCTLSGSHPDGVKHAFAEGME